MIGRREFLTAATAFAQPPEPRRKPNLVFILADDLGCFDLGCYGQKLIETPNIDRLAAEGLRFTQAYAGGAVCAPSRCTLMTGMHLGHATIRDNHSRRTGGRVPLRAGDVTVAEVLKNAGYATGIFGKWGLGEPDTPGIPNRQGFDDWFGFLNQDHAVDYFTDHLWRNESKETLTGNLGGRRREYATELFTREAARFIRTHRNRPFFLYLPYTAPHFNIDAPSDLQYGSKPWPKEARTVAAMISYMDRGVGQILDLLRELRLEQDTLVMFSSDNGAGHKQFIPLFQSTGSLRGAKGELYEGGIRAPLIARWPGRIAPGRVAREPVAFYDFLPTAAGIAGAETPKGIDGVSFAPLLFGGRQPPREYLYWERPSKQRFDQAVRMEKWKAIRLGAGAPVEIFDLEEDEPESKNLAADKPGLVARAQELFRTARVENPEYPSRPPGV